MGDSFYHRQLLFSAGVFLVDLLLRVGLILAVWWWLPMEPIESAASQVLAGLLLGALLSYALGPLTAPLARWLLNKAVGRPIKSGA